jgi:hypothetical protein
MLELANIREKLIEYKANLFQRYKIASMAIFGSVSRGEATENSDVDILVEFDEPIGIRFIDLADELEEILETKVDLVSKNGVKQRYFQHIEPELEYV